MMRNWHGTALGLHANNEGWRQKRNSRSNFIDLENLRCSLRSARECPTVVSCCCQARISNRVWYHAHMPLALGQCQTMPSALLVRTPSGPGTLSPFRICWVRVKLRASVVEAGDLEDWRGQPFRAPSYKTFPSSQIPSNSEPWRFEILTPACFTSAISDAF